MNARPSDFPAVAVAAAFAPRAARAANEAVAVARERYRERDFGIGYGRSSGYATPRRYAASDARALFRCA